MPFTSDYNGRVPRPSQSPQRTQKRTTRSMRSDMQRRNRIGMLAGVITLALTSSALAQRTTADITGTVTDTTGAILPGASVTAVCPETNLTRTAVTDAQGGYRLAELPICVYKVTVELS